MSLTPACTFLELLLQKASATDSILRSIAAERSSLIRLWTLTPDSHRRRLASTYALQCWICTNPQQTFQTGHCTPVLWQLFQARKVDHRHERLPMARYALHIFFLLSRFTCNSSVVNLERYFSLGANSLGSGLKCFTRQSRMYVSLMWQ